METNLVYAVIFDPCIYTHHEMKLFRSYDEAWQYLVSVYEHDVAEDERCYYIVKENDGHIVYFGYVEAAELPD